MAETEQDAIPAEQIGLNTLRPAPGSRRPRKRVGRGEGSGTGKTSGRGQKGAGSRSAREIVVRSMLRTHRPTFLDPSPQVTATMTALGLEGWPYAPPGVGRSGPQVFSGVS